MMNTKSRIKSVYAAYALILTVLTSCRHESKPVFSDSDILHLNQDQLTRVIIFDVFTPPVASRLYVYSSLASYEAIRYSSDSASSITARLRGFHSMPEPVPGRKYDFALSASKAFFKVVRNARIFSADSLNGYENRIYGMFRKKLDDSVFSRSSAFGDEIASVILARAANDGYNASRGKPKFLGSDEPGKWKLTPPDYLDGVEWCWNTMIPMLMDSASQFKPSVPPPFSMDTSSLFYKSILEVYNINKNLTEEQKTIARYWDDNPFVIEHSGHMMFGNKKITPGGHWMGICAIASKMSGADAVKTARAYALTSLALYEAFISCWDEKYRSCYVRPVTVINEKIDPSWLPFLQTPPFPEYTSGHSTITACAAEVLSSLYGKNFAFQDTSDLRYIGMQRHFNSFGEAASEASISRVYGGIHYRFSVDTGAAQGKKLGEFINSRLGP